jgi:hypothetical protein
VIANNFTGTGTLNITLEEGLKDHYITCPTSTITGTTGSWPNASATINGWSLLNCTASNGAENLGSATVTIPTPQTATAESLSKVKLTAFMVKATYNVGVSTCKPEFPANFPVYDYSSGPTTNQMSTEYGHSFNNEFFPPPGCLGGGIAILESAFTFPDPQFEVTEEGEFLLRNSNSAGSPDVSFEYGLPTDKPITGDWNNDGVDSIGVYRPSNSTFYLRNNNSSGSPNHSFVYGIANDIPITGDWNNDGVDSIGVYRPSNSTFYLRNSNSAGGSADYIFAYGIANDIPITGDWNGDHLTTVGAFRR